MGKPDYPQILLKNRKPDRINTLDEYRQDGGYEALAAVIAEGQPRRVKEILLDAVLLGRGGAGFPAGQKVRTVAEKLRREVAGRAFVITEGETTRLVFDFTSAGKPERAAAL